MNKDTSFYMMMAFGLFFVSSGSQSLMEAGCFFEGRHYGSGERIPRQHACHICICYERRVDCSWMDCPPPPEECAEMTQDGVCNPTLYICPIPEEMRNLKRRTRASDIGHWILIDEIADPDCLILGVPYKTGDLIGVATHPCLECRCARQELYCSPRCCFTPLRDAQVPGPFILAMNRASRPQEKHPLYYLREEIDGRSKRALQYA